MIPKTRINLKPFHASDPEMALKTRKGGHLCKPGSQLTSVINPQGSVTRVINAGSFGTTGMDPRSTGARPSMKPANPRGHHSL